MERKKRSKGRGWESCYVKKIYGTFGVEMRAYGQKLVKFCTHTHTRLSYSSNDRYIFLCSTYIPAQEISQRSATGRLARTSMPLSVRWHEKNPYYSGDMYQYIHVWSLNENILPSHYYGIEVVDEASCATVISIALPLSQRPDFRMFRKDVLKYRPHKQCSQVWHSATQTRGLQCVHLTTKWNEVIEYVA